MRRRIGFVIGIAALVLSFFLPLRLDVKLSLGIALLAAVFWIGKVFPLYVTAILIPVLVSAFGIMDATQALSPFFSPIVALLFSGFIFSKVISKYGIDNRISGHLLKVVGEKGEYILLWVLVGTAVLSSIISSLAAAVLMAPVGISLIKNLRRKESGLSISLMVGIAFAASIGGIMTVSGSPVNSFLASAAGLGFFQWSLATIPFGLTMLIFLWLILIKMYPISLEKRYVSSALKSLEDITERSKEETYILGIIGLLFALWLTVPIHGIDYGISALFGVFLLYALGLLNENELKEIDWGTLLLMGGGLCLGASLVESGLAEFVIGKALSVGGNSFALASAALAFTIVLFSIVMNNFSIAVLAVPIVAGIGDLSNSIPLMIVVGIAANMAFFLPISSPTNALVYGSCRIDAKDIMKAGLLMSILAIILLIVFNLGYWNLLF
ncbi:SLC13 family permease [Candidatus Undinarchaeota archaeon]